MSRFFGRMMVLLTLAAASLHAQSGKSAGVPARPKLVVGLMVDQMRWDFLVRYAPAYGEGGFKRMLREGFACENTQINYASTITACGHASVYTGTVPAIHGITGNNFVIQSTGQKTYCTQDDGVQTVGAATDAGKMSPKLLLTTTIGDELKMATNGRAKVFGIAIKDRGAILPAGHMADGAYWWDETGDGAWITSTFYRAALPEWVTKFNAEKTAVSYLKNDWAALPETLALDQSTADDVPWESPLEQDGKPTLPAKTSAMPKPADLIAATPFGNTMTLDFARELIVNEKLGADEETDLFAISLSTPDYVGHKFGPNSVEVQDTYIRLDRELAAFFAFLDKTVGKGNYLVFLTADHGVANGVRYLQERRVPVGLFNTTTVVKELDTLLANKFGKTGLVLGFENRQMSFNEAEIAAAGIDRKALIAEATAFMRTRPGTAYAFEVGVTVPVPDIPEPIRTRVINAYNPDRSGSLQVIAQPGWGYPKGSSHGTWAPYDAHIPLVWMGWKIPQGALYRETHITDIAPTLAALLKVQEPSGASGDVVVEVVKGK